MLLRPGGWWWSASWGCGGSTLTQEEDKSWGLKRKREWRFQVELSVLKGSGGEGSGATRWRVPACRAKANEDFNLRTA